MQKGSALPFVLITLVLVGAILGYLFLKQDTKTVLQSPIEKSSEESKLKTYTNNNLGFEFQFPKDLQVIEDSEENFNKRGNGDFRKNFTYYITYPPAKFLGAIVVGGESLSFETNPLTIWVFDNPEDLSIDSWYKNYWYYPFVWGDYTSRKNDVAPTQDATISGQSAKYGVVTYQPGSPKFIYKSQNQKMYLFRIIKTEKNSGDKILKGFKLLK